MGQKKSKSIASDLLKLFSKQTKSKKTNPAPVALHKIQTIILTTNAIKHQDTLRLLSSNPVPVKANFGLFNGNARLLLSCKYGEVGNFPKSFEKSIFEKYQKSNGLSCEIEVLDYSITTNGDKFQCTAKIQVTPN